MASVNPDVVRPLLVERRGRLQHALVGAPEAEDITRLLGEVDAALDRLATDRYGLCETCHGEIEPELLEVDPLTRFCLDDLSAAERRDLERDLEVAGRIQRSLLPGSKLLLGDWELALHFAPAGPVSGDFCDLVRPADSGPPLLVFGDVSGKGVAAGLLSAQLAAIFRSLADDPAPLPALVERANRVFRAAAVTPHFATLVAVRPGPDGRLEVCNAGHCPPLVLSARGAAAVAPTGLPVGTFLSSRYAAQTLELAPGDLLVLYTDGLTEARDADGTEYGSERLEALLPGLRGRAPGAVVAALLADVDRFRGSASRHDDLSILVLRRLA